MSVFCSFPNSSCLTSKFLTLNWWRIKAIDPMSNVYLLLSIIWIGIRYWLAQVQTRYFSNLMTNETSEMLIFILHFIYFACVCFGFHIEQHKWDSRWSTHNESEASEEKLPKISISQWTARQYNRNAVNSFAAIRSWKNISLCACVFDLNCCCKTENMNTHIFICSCVPRCRAVYLIFLSLLLLCESQWIVLEQYWSSNFQKKITSLCACADSLQSGEHQGKSMHVIVRHVVFSLVNVNLTFDCEIHLFLASHQ